MDRSLWLVVCGASISGGAFAVRPGRHVIGRSEECDIRLLHRSVSRRHAMLVYGNGELWLRDLGSSNGTFVNGERVTCAKITAGTFLQLGRVGLDLVDRLPEERAVAGSAIETDRESADREAEEALQRVHFPPKRDQVARLLLQGLTEKQVAARVHRSKHTVHWHVTRIYRQVHVRSRAAFAAFFTRLRRRQKPGR